MRVCECACFWVCPYVCVLHYSSQLQKKLWLNPKSSAYPSYCPTMPWISLHTQIVCKRPRVVYVSTCRVFTATTQANLSADGDLLSGSFILQTARSLSFYVNSSAFCPTSLWIFICMWTHCFVEWGTAPKRKAILGVDAVWKAFWFRVSVGCVQHYHDFPLQELLNRGKKKSSVAKKLLKILFLLL